MLKNSIQDKFRAENTTGRHFAQWQLTLLSSGSPASIIWEMGLPCSFANATCVKVAARGGMVKVGSANYLPNRIKYDHICS